MQELKPQYDMSQSTKVHVITNHLIEYTNLTGKPLIKSSEQVVESSHCSLHKFLHNSSYVQKDISALSYGVNLTRGICNYNAEHI